MFEASSRVDIRHLRVFIALARRLNFSRVADDLYLNQSAISRIIAELERDVESKLFERDHRQVQLTAAGASLLASAETIVAEFDGWIERAREAGRGVVGELRLGAFVPSFLNNRITAEAMRRFRIEHPQARVETEEIFSVDIPTALRSRRIEIGFGRDVYEARDLICRTLLLEPLIAVVSRTQRLAARAALTIGDLQGQRVVTYARTVTPAITDRVQDAAAHAGIAMPVEATTIQLQSLYQLAASEGAIAVIPESSAPTGDRRLVTIPFDDPALNIPFVMAHLDTQLSPLATGFVASLLQEASAAVAGDPQQA